MGYRPLNKVKRERSLLSMSLFFLSFLFLPLFLFPLTRGWRERGGGGELIPGKRKRYCLRKFLLTQTGFNFMHNLTSDGALTHKVYIYISLSLNKIYQPISVLALNLYAYRDHSSCHFPDYCYHCHQIIEFSISEREIITCTSRLQPQTLL